MTSRSRLPSWRAGVVASALVVVTAGAVMGRAAHEVPTMIEPAPRPLRLGAVGFYNPRLMYLKYQVLVDYLSEATGLPWELEIATNYQETVDALCAGRLTLAYLGPFTYVRANERCGVEPIARLQTGGSPTYRSVIMVRSRAPFQSVADLAGTRFGFGAPLSTSSHLIPRAMLLDAGIPLADMACRFYGHHERAARAVLLDEVDACGVRDVVGQRFIERGMRVLATSGPIPNFPIVAGPGLSPKLRRQVEEALIERPAHDAVVAARIASWDPEIRDGFARGDDAEYDSIRRLVVRLLGPSGLIVDEAELVAAVGCR